MYYILYALLLGLFVTSGAEMSTFNGITTIKDEQHEDIAINGVGTLERVQARNVKASGAITMNECKIEQDLHTNGAASLREVTVYGALSANGGVSITTGEFGLVKANGGCSVKGAKVAGSFKANGGCSFDDVSIGSVCNINGGLSGTKVDFYDLVVSGQRVELKQSIVRGDISITTLRASSSASWQWLASLINLFHKTFSSSKQQKLVLEDTIVEGSVTFAKPEGLVVLHGSSQIKGNISGARVLRK